MRKQDIAISISNQIKNLNLKDKGFENFLREMVFQNEETMQEAAIRHMPEYTHSKSVKNKSVLCGNKGYQRWYNLY